MTTPRWPQTLPPKETTFTVDLPSTSGGPAIGGYEQVVQSTTGRWSASFTFHISPHRPVGGNGVLFFRWFQGYMQGRANSIVMPVFDRGLTPAGLAGSLLAPVTHSDGTSFSDGTLYDQPSTPAQFAGAWPVGALSLMVNMLAGQTPQPGQHFSAGERLYRIESAMPYLGLVVPGAAPVYWTLDIWPPLRFAVTDGQWCEFDNPACIMRLAKDDGAQLALKPGYQGDVTIDLVEAPVS
jgi:hypothetical protein